MQKTLTTTNVAYNQSEDASSKAFCKAYDISYIEAEQRRLAILTALVSEGFVPTLILKLLTTVPPSCSRCAGFIEIEPETDALIHKLHGV